MTAAPTTTSPTRGETFREQIRTHAFRRQELLLSKLDAVPVHLMAALAQLPPAAPAPHILPLHFQAHSRKERALAFAFVSDPDSLAKILNWIFIYSDLVEQAEIKDIGSSVYLQWPELSLCICQMASMRANQVLDALKQLKASDQAPAPASAGSPA